MSKDLYICKKCGTVAKPNKTSGYKGTFVIELGIWIVMIVLSMFTFGVTILFAIGYSLWRLTGKKKIVCPECSSEDIVSVETPIGKKLFKDVMAEANQ